MENTLHSVVLNCGHNSRGYAITCASEGCGAEACGAYCTSHDIQRCDACDRPYCSDHREDYNGLVLCLADRQLTESRDRTDLFESIVDLVSTYDRDMAYEVLQMVSIKLVTK